MASQPIEHHRPVEYRLADHGRQSSFAIDRSSDGRRIEVNGFCPGCGGRTGVVWEYGTPGAYKGWPFRRGEPARQPANGPRTVTCDCGHVHPNRPEGSWDQGCGAHWQVELA